MTLSFIYPTNLELSLIAQDKISTLMAEREIFNIMPVENDDNFLIAWEQQDNYTGLQQARGLNGSPPRVKSEGAKRYVMEPGVYGEYELIDERDISMRRPYGSLTGNLDINDLVLMKQDKLLARRLDRQEFIGWLLLTTGTFSISGANSQVLHTDTYPIQTFTGSPTWAANPTTSHPLADFRAVQYLARGHSVSFGANAVAYMNLTTWNAMIANTNAADLYGRRTSGFGTINSMGDITKLFVADNLPQIKVYDLGYLDDTNTFQKWIPDNKVVVIGQRPQNQPVMKYKMVRNASNPNGEAGAYQRVIDDQDEIPRTIQVHDGHNGGIALYFPSAVVVMSV